MKFVRQSRASIITISVMGIISLLQAQQLAFPSAEGFGKYTVGGRGGKVFEVTNLNDAGEGSLRAAINAKGPRTVVFRVSGTIDLKSDLVIVNSNITIAGQTAPGDGICIKRYPLLITGNEVIIRYIRVRFGDESGEDADALTAMRGPKNIIIDHVSASWSVDETLSVYHCMNVTVQWCMVTESMYNSNHTKGSHGYGGIWGGPNATFHHNLLAHHTKRNARICGGAEDTDFRNNVIYNWGFHSTYGGEMKQDGSEDWKYTAVNIVNNYYKPGPATLTDDTHHRIVEAWKNKRAGGGWGKFYVTGNYMDGSPEVTKDNWNGGVQSNDKNIDISILKLDTPATHVPIMMQTAQEAYKSVLEHVGCNLHRDTVDARIIEEVRNGNATYEGPTYENDFKVADKSKKCGIIDSQDDVGGWPELKSLPAPADSDHDGMPDDWETKNGLNSTDASDGSKIGKDGYTNLENYLNSLVAGNGPVTITAYSGKNSKNKPRFTLNYLNAFNSSSTIQYSVLSKSKVKLEVFTLAGKLVTTLVDEVKEPGSYSANFKSAGLTKGLYTYKFSDGNLSYSRK